MAKVDWCADGWRVFEDAAEFDKEFAAGILKRDVVIRAPSILRLEGEKRHGYLDIPGLTAAELMQEMQ